MILTDYLRSSPDATWTIAAQCGVKHGVIRLPEDMVSLGDGLSELVLVKDPGNLAELSVLANSVLTRRFDSDKLMILHTKKARFLFDKPVPWTRDGESGGSYQEIELRNYKAAIRLIF